MKTKISTEELARADQLVALGIPLDEEVLEPVRREHNGLLVSQDPFILGRTIFDLPCERTGVALSIYIEPFDRCVCLDHAVIDIPWCDHFSWLDDPWRKRPREQAYWFPAPPDRGFEREIVLNHLFQRRTKLFPDGWYEGLLLGMGEGPIPEYYQDRQRFQTKLSIFDSRGTKYESDVDLMVERELKRRQGTTIERVRRQRRCTGSETMISGSP